jgi:cytochrome c-type biogenesis protein CcmH
MIQSAAFLHLWARKAPGPSACLMVLVLSMVLLPSAAAAAPAQTSLADVEDEVMCPICGTLLELAESPQAERERVFIKGQIAAGRSKAEIEDALVAEYGREVLALPGGSGFDLSAYLVPAIAFAFAVAGLAVGVRRWRRAGGPPDGSTRPPAASGPEGEDAARLEADLARYDL